ncbi:MAG: P-II family nitrogen regulator [Methanoregula sp.]
MKEIMAVIRMRRTSATKKALIAAGVAGFTAVKVSGRGRLVTDLTQIEECKEKLLSMGVNDFGGVEDTEKLVTSFLNGSRFFPRRLFTILAHDEDVPRIVDAITCANKTEYGIGDGVIFVLPVLDAVRVRTGESGEAAIW